MNHCLLELYKLSMVPHTATDPSNNMQYESKCFSADKFAELIIKECLDKISSEQDKANQNWQCKNGVHISYVIQEHFGVE